MDNRINAYIAKSAEFARPILTRIRKLVHQACPEVEEDIKWGMPYFLSDGANLCWMAAFQQHCVFGFWKAQLMQDPNHILELENRTAMGHLSRIGSLKDLPPGPVLVAYIRQAAMLNAESKKVSSKMKKPTTVAVALPAELSAGFKKSKAAKSAFDTMSPSHKNEYLHWIAEAKTEATRKKRIEEMMEKLKKEKTGVAKTVKK